MTIGTNAAIQPQAAGTAARAAEESRRQLPGQARQRGVGRPTTRRGRSTARHRRSTGPRRRRQAHPRFAWYLGLTLMAALEVIEWPVAIAIGASHEIVHRTHSRILRELVEGIEAGG